MNVGNQPKGIAGTPDGKKVYVTNGYSNTVSIIDTSTNNVTATVKVGTSPFGVAVTPDGKKVYVTNYYSDNVSVIDTSTNTVTATVKVGTAPIGVAVTPDGKKAYVACYGSNIVSIINTTTDTVTSMVTLESRPNAFGQFIGTRPSSLLDTTTVLTSSANRYGFKQPMKFTAKVSTISQGTEKPSGTVTFMDENNLIGFQTLSSGQASLVTSSLSVGSHSITATYSGDSNFKSSTSSTFKLTVTEMPFEHTVNSLAELSKNPLVSIIIASIFVGSSLIIIKKKYKSPKLSRFSKMSELILEHPVVSGIIATVIGGIILIIIQKKFFP